MAKVSKTITISAGLMARIDEEANKNANTFSSEVEQVISAYYSAIDRNKEESVELRDPSEWQIECGDCDAKYSKSAGPVCPSCGHENLTEDEAALLEAGGE